MAQIPSLSFETKIDYKKAFEHLYDQNGDLLEDFLDMQTQRDAALLRHQQACRLLQSGTRPGRKPQSPNKRTPTDLHYANGRKRHNRRCANEIAKSFPCPYFTCRKNYGCEGSLNLHLKGKHSGGTKTIREKYARQLCLALEKGEKEPSAPFKMYPGFRQFALREFTTLAIRQRKESSVQEHTM